LWHSKGREYRAYIALALYVGDAETRSIGDYVRLLGHTVAVDIIACV